MSRAVRIALDRAVADHLAHGVERIHRLAERAPGDIAAPRIDHFGRAEASHGHAREAAVPAAAAPSGTIRFEDYRFDAVVPGEVVGARQPGVAAADDRDLGVGASGRGTVVTWRRSRGSSPVGFGI